MMKQPVSKDLLPILLAAFAGAATLVGLVSDIPQVSSTTTGKVILGIIFMGIVVYVAYHIYTKLFKAYWELRKLLEEIKRLLVEFSRGNDAQGLKGKIDLELINLILSTKQKVSLPMNVKDLQFYPNDKVVVIVDKGHNDGLLDRMTFKVFHKIQYIELGICPCTVAYDESTLTISLNPNCPVKINEITRDSLEVRLIEPTDNAKVNALIANLLHLIQCGC